MTLLLKDMPGLFNQIKKNVHSFIQLNIDYKKKLKEKYFLLLVWHIYLMEERVVWKLQLAIMWLDA